METEIHYSEENVTFDSAADLKMHQMRQQFGTSKKTWTKFHRSLLIFCNVHILCSFISSADRLENKKKTEQTNKITSQGQKLGLLGL